MKKIRGYPWMALILPSVKLMLIMRLTMFLMILGILSSTAKSWSQFTNLNLDYKRTSIKQILKDIEDKSKYSFVYSNNDFDVEREVDLRLTDANIETILDRLLDGTGMGYRMIDRVIVIAPKDTEQIPGSQVQADRTVSGKVTDASGAPLPGVTISVKGTTKGTISGTDGGYSLADVANDATLVFSFIGMKTQEAAVAGNQAVNIVMQEETIGIEEVVAVGYGVQKRASLTGAVSAIRGDDIVTTKNENAQNMLTGKIAGVRVTQRTAEPGTFNNNFDIRGMGAPLIIIDGIPRTTSDFQRLDPNDIESTSVLKDASAAIYGVRAANGVVLVTTKKGNANRIELDYSGTFTWQIPSGMPKTIDAIEYMTLRNELAMHNVNGGSPVFNDEQFEDYLSGRLQSTDWNSLVFAKTAPQTIHNLSAMGGNDRTTFYAGLGYQYQEGFFKSGDLKYNKYNIRSNVTSKITDRLTFDLGINLVMDEQDRPYQDSWWIIRGYWRQGAHIPAYANNDPTKPYHGLIEGDNPISFMDKDIVGFNQFNNKWVQPAVSLTYDIPGVKGLSVKGLFSYDYYVADNTYFQKEYKQYRYDEASQTYEEFIRQSPNRIRRQTYSKTQELGQFSMNYARTFDKHVVSGVVLWEAQKRTGDNFSAQRDLLLQLPYLFAGISDEQLANMEPEAEDFYEDTNLALAGRVNYEFNNRYLAEILFRYDGSSKFGQGSQWGFFPAASIGWRISEENFFKTLSFASSVNQLKLRASYGKTGDDNASSYQFIYGYNYPTGSDVRNFTGGYVFDGSFYASADHKGIPNPNITWFTAKTFDLGVDFEGWEGLLGLTFDYFSRKREGLLATRSGGIPTVVGAGLPEENLNSDRTYGFDLEVTHRNQIDELRYNLKGIFSLTRVKRLYVERDAIGSSWNNWKNNQNNRLQGVHWGLEGDGRFESWEDIWSSPTYIGRGTIIGDYRYEDWNGDGEINDNDVHPIRYNQEPWLNFSLIIDASWKNFDLNMLWQGAGKSSLIYGEQLRQPLWGSGDASAMQQFMNRWHPVDPKADPYDPSVGWVSGRYAYTGTLPDENSSFNTVNSTYLRLKSIELGYTLPKQWLAKLGFKNLRVYMNAYNLLTFTKVKYVDPEHPEDTYGYLYPLNKTVSVGVNVKF